MKKELENELEPMDMASPDFWGEATTLLFNNPGKVLPVYLEDPISKELVGNYFLRLVKERKKIFVQVEGFDSTVLETAFIVGSSDKWKRLQPGIYRLNITR